MKIRTLRRTMYRDCPIYFRQFGNTFEYLAVVKGEIYAAHVTIIKTWWQMLLFRDFTEKQLVNATNYLSRIAETTVDHVLGE